MLILAGCRVGASWARAAQKLKARDQLNKGVRRFQERPVPRSRRALQNRRGTGSRLLHRPPVSGDRLHAAVHPGRRVAREQARWPPPPTTSFKGARRRTPRTPSPSPPSLRSTSTRRSGTRRSKWYEKLIAVDPQERRRLLQHRASSPGPSGIPVYGTARANLGMKQEDPGPIKDKKVKEELKAKYGPVIDDGLKTSTRRSRSIPSTTTPWLTKTC